MKVRVFTDNGNISICETNIVPVLKTHLNGKVYLEVTSDVKGELWIFNWDNVNAYQLSGVTFANE